MFRQTSWYYHGVSIRLYAWYMSFPILLLISSQLLLYLQWCILLHLYWLSRKIGIYVFLWYGDIYFVTQIELRQRTCHVLLFSIFFVFFHECCGFSWILRSSLLPSSRRVAVVGSGRVGSGRRFSKDNLKITERTKNYIKNRMMTPFVCMKSICPCVCWWSRALKTTILMSWLTSYFKKTSW